jgi:hypothetical protein
MQKLLNGEVPWTCLGLLSTTNSNEWLGKANKEGYVRVKARFRCPIRHFVWYPGYLVKLNICPSGTNPPPQIGRQLNHKRRVIRDIWYVLEINSSATCVPFPDSLTVWRFQTHSEHELLKLTELPSWQWKSTQHTRFFQCFQRTTGSRSSRTLIHLNAFIDKSLVRLEDTIKVIKVKSSASKANHNKLARFI